METISVSLPDDLEAELESYVEEENLDRSAAIRKLLAEGLAEWRRTQALERFEADEVTLSQAAELAGTTVWDFAALAKGENATWVSDDHLEADLEDL